MFQLHSSIITPPDNTILWRYIDLEKLLALLATRSLHLCRLDHFSDPWEGVWPKPLVDQIRKNWGATEGEGFFRVTTKSRQSFFVSCWHANTHESAALWDQYAKSSGFAIRTTVGRLKQAISSREFYLGSVEYLDFEKDNVSELNMLRPAFLKRKSFQHEQEVRLMVWDLPVQGEEIAWDQCRSSHILPVDLDTLIESVFASPTLDDWLLPHVQELFCRFGLSNIQIRKSDLYAPHVY